MWYECDRQHEKAKKMKKEVQQKKGIFRTTLVRGSALLMFIIAVVWSLRTLPDGYFATPGGLERIIESTDPFWAPLLFVLIYTVGTCLLLPASLFILLGAAMFGPFQGFLYGWIGAMTGAIIAFFAGRALGRGVIESLMGDRLRKYDDAIGRNGFTTVLYLRLINTPLIPMSFGMSLTGIRFRDYATGTGAGIITGLFILTSFGGAIGDAWVTKSWEELISPKLCLASALFILSCLIPLIIRKIRGNTRVKAT